jgi:uncharacterized protein
MKISKYNHVIPYNSKYKLVFNGITGAFMTLDTQAQKVYEQISEGKTPVLNYTDAELDFKKLKECGVIVADDADEFQYVKAMNRLTMFQPTTLQLTVAPTLACNFRCPYCYENKKKTRMTSEIQEKTITFARHQLKSITSLSICWYGGEPLLEKKMIWTMSKKLRSLCENAGCRYTALMATNGYLLDKNTALKLNEHNVSHIQITIDGPKEIHDTRRILVNGNGTFDRIMKNLTDAVDIISSITLRVNVDKDNADYVVELLDVLTDQGLKNRIKLYYASVTSDTLACQDISDKCFTGDQYANLEGALYKQTIEKGYTMVKYPRPTFSHCGAARKNSYVIDPEGDLYKCWNAIGLKEEKIGHVGGPLEYNNNHVKWLSWDPLSYEKCKECTLSPVCMGGCPHRTLCKNLVEPECRDWKNNLEEMLLLYYKSYMQRKTEELNPLSAT